MGAAVQATGLGGVVRRVFARSASLSPPLECVADVRIPAANVHSALRSLTDGVRSVRRYAVGGAASPTQSRRALIAALGAARQEAKRATSGLGVDILEARGSEDHIYTVFTALAPYAAPGAFVQVGTGETAHYFTVENGVVVTQPGEHPQATVADVRVASVHGFGAA